MCEMKRCEVGDVQVVELNFVSERRHKIRVPRGTKLEPAIEAAGISRFWHKVLSTCSQPTECHSDNDSLKQCKQDTCSS